MSNLFPILGHTPVEVFDHSLTDGQFKQLPSIYAIEATSACNLECPMCLRSQSVNKHPSLLKMALLKKMHKRGDFAGSSYIELQLSGEPTIHPRLGALIKFLQTEVGVLVGLSTHGLNMTKYTASGLSADQDHKVPVAQVLLRLDALTISVDSVDPQTYHKMRYPAHLESLYQQLDFFFDELTEYEGYLPFIELQLVRSSVADGSGDVKALMEVAEQKGWLDYASIRTTNDCFYEMDGRLAPGTMTRNSPICINPFTSVNISQDGLVTSCCYIFDDKKDEINYYGDLNEQSLEEIWNGPRVAAMRESHLKGPLKDACAKCYYKSPELIHQNIISRLVRARRGG